MFIEISNKICISTPIGVEYFAIGNVSINICLLRRPIFSPKALAKLKPQRNNSNETGIFLLTALLDMHKRIKKGEDPMLLNDLISVEPASRKKTLTWFVNESIGILKRQ